MTTRPDHYIPAAGQDWLLPFYDPVLRIIMREQTFKKRLIDEARIPNGSRVLDLGCGTGTLTLMIKRFNPQCEVHGLDGDPKALEIARRKAEREQMTVAFDQGLSYELPYSNKSFERVLSSLMFHHLTREHKLHTFKELGRVLQAGGSLHIVDFGKPSTSWGRAVARLVSRGEQIRDNIEGRLPVLLRESGFASVSDSRPHGTIFGSLSFYHASWR